jgi:hypothetical protein
MTKRALALTISATALIALLSLLFLPQTRKLTLIDVNLTSLLSHFNARAHHLSHLPDIPATTTRCVRSHTDGSCVFFHSVLDVHANPPQIHTADKPNAPILGLHAGGTNVVPLPVSEQHAVVCATPDYGSLAIVGQYVHSNHGHVLGDEVFAAWQFLTIWGFEMEASSLHIATNDRAPSLIQYDALLAHSATQVHTFDELRHRHPSGLICVGKLFAGAGRLGYSQGMTCADGHRGIECRAPYLSEFKATFRAFRVHALQNLGVPSKRQPDAPFNVLILEKDTSAAAHHCVLGNVPALVDALKGHLTDALVTAVRWTKTTLREQAMLVSQADALVALPGSDLMAAVWMRPEAEILQPCRFVEGVWDPGNEQQIWFRMTNPITVWCNFAEHGASVLNLPVEEFVLRVAAIKRRMQRSGVLGHKNGE